MKIISNYLERRKREQKWKANEAGNRKGKASTGRACPLAPSPTLTRRKAVLPVSRGSCEWGEGLEGKCANAANVWTREKGRGKNATSL